MIAQWAANGSYVYQADALDVLNHLQGSQVRLAYLDPPFATGRRQTTTQSSSSYTDTWPTFDAYMDWLTPILSNVIGLLGDSGGVLALHLDHRAAADVKVWLDKCLGRDAFVNEVIWCYNSGGASKRTFARKHDTILVYRTSSDYVFNVQREPYPRDYGDRPGFHPEGRMVNDHWQIGILSTTALERTGFPSQKPVELVARFVRAFTNPGDLVVDVFSGSGTTAVASRLEGRRFIVGDVNPDAITSTIGRLNKLETR